MRDMLIQIAIFATSLFFLVKSADYLVDSAQGIGKYFKLPSFIVGVLVVGMGTSAPELASSLAAAIQGVPQMVISNALGSNIANILLIVGLIAILAKNIKVSKNLIDLDIPLLALVTALFAALAFDGEISRLDSVFLLAGLLYYVTYSISLKGSFEEDEEKVQIYKEFAMFAASLVALIFSAKFLVSSTVALSALFAVPVTAVTAFAVALGTSLPELFVSLSAVKKGAADMAIGNIFGSNVFNLLAVVGVPAAFVSLPIDALTYGTVLPVAILATFLFLISGISRKIYTFEGVFFLLIYVYSILKIFAFV